MEKPMAKYNTKHLATDPDIETYVKYIGANSNRAAGKLKERFHELTRAEAIAIILFHKNKATS